MNILIFPVILKMAEQSFGADSDDPLKTTDQTRRLGLIVCHALCVCFHVCVCV